MKEVNKDVLYDLYVIRGKPMHEVAKEMGIAVGSVYNYLKKFGIQTRNHAQAFEKLKDNGWEYPEAGRKRISAIHKGKVVSEETRRKMSVADKVGGIGHKKPRKDGYVYVYFPDHPKASNSGYIMEHILVMEALIGRHLADGEVVHHINGIRNDNRKENLKLMDFREHARYHMNKRYEKKRRNDLLTK